MIEKLISDWFTKMGWTWKLKGGRVVTPSEVDVMEALDEAAKQLYNERPGAQLEVGRLIIQKKNRGHDVYVYVGEYL